MRILEPPRGRQRPGIECRRQYPVHDGEVGCEARDGAARPNQRAGRDDARHRLYAHEMDQSGESRPAASDHCAAQRIAERATELDLEKRSRSCCRRAVRCFGREQQRRGNTAAKPCAMQAAGQPHQRTADKMNSAADQGSRLLTVMQAVRSARRTGGADSGQVLEALAQQLASFTAAGRSMHGLPLKNPDGISLKPVVTQGCTGKSSIRTG